MNTKDKEDSLTLEILETIEGKSNVTQRHLAQRMGVALGLANSYLKRCVRKGLIKIRQAPANRYLYYLTPKGFAEKSRLTAEYLSSSFEFYRKASASCVETFGICKKNGWSRILLCGVSELAEIASLRAQEHGIVIIGIYDPGSDRSRFLDRPVRTTLDGASDCDAFMLTALSDPNARYKDVASKVGKEKVLVPRILGLVAESRLNMG
ncbi:MAG: winged helix-turn-helix transcriptional regulator [Gammaproteobacteria bacterium]|nr:winged helix-turn-helix transcriptional regulator [Gammaproteobacteria bacterium]MCI0591181.1 winged helix-turn-helix transcriptional regulator [Gammaproteobacteria bacterium]